MSTEQNEAVESVVETEVQAISLEFNPKIFEPREILLEIANEVATIQADPAQMTKDDFELVNKTKNKLVKLRTSIEKQGKAAREEATKFNKAVKAYEDELIAIIEPQEKRLKEIESAAKLYALQQERIKTLPEYKEKLASIGDTVQVDDEFLLTLDPNQRDMYYNQRLSAKLEADKAAIEEAKKAEQEAKDRERAAIVAKRREILIQLGFKVFGSLLTLETNEAPISVPDEAIATMLEGEFIEKVEFWRTIAEAQKAYEAKLADEKKAADIKAAEEAATKKAQEEAAQKAAAEEAKRLADEEADKQAKEEQERKAQEEERQRQQTESYQKWLSDNAYNSDTDIIQQAPDGTYMMYRKVSTFNLLP